MAIQPVSGMDQGLQPAAISRATPKPVPAFEPVVTPPSATPSTEQLQKAMREIQRVVAPVAQNLQFSIDDETGKTVVKVVDVATKEIVRQIPSEEVLAITHALDRFKGILLRQKA